MPDHLSWTSQLLRAFYTEGIRHVYISPGSRSTPLVLAAAIHPGFEKHVVLDERSAAFQALGNAKATGLPALLICTSGTALTHYHPAVIEAKYSGVPMIILSADRPPYLRGTGSSQTIDQLKIYGDSVVSFHEAGEPVHMPEDYRRLKLLARQASVISISKAGPVHINLPFRKPFEPSKESLNHEEGENKRQVSDQKNNRKSILKISPVSTPGEEVTELINNSRQPLIVAGPDESWRALRQTAELLSDSLNAPVIAEPGSHIDSPINILNRYDIILRSINLKDSLKPDLIIRLGGRPFSKSLQLFEDENIEIPVIQLMSRYNNQDNYSHTGSRIYLHDNELKLKGLKKKHISWLEKWHTYNTLAEKILSDTIVQTRSLTDGHVFHFFSKLLLNNWDVMCSNSFTIRDLALFAPSPSSMSRIFVNRGAAGIDGIISTGIGMNHASRERTAILIGDLAFLHDSNALLSLKNSGQTILIIVINNNGGNIFRMLPVYNESKYYHHYFEAPQNTDLAKLAMAHGLPYLLIDSKKNLSQTDLSGISEKKLLIECKTDPDASMEMRKLLWNSNLSDG